MMLELLSKFRSLGFGGLLGAGLMGILYIIFKDKIPLDISLYQFLIIGSLIGCGLNKSIERLYNLILCGSIGRDVELYWSVIKLYSIKGIIGENRFKAEVALLFTNNVLENKTTSQTQLSLEELTVKNLQDGATDITRELQEGIDRQNEEIDRQNEEIDRQNNEIRRNTILLERQGYEIASFDKRLETVETEKQKNLEQLQVFLEKLAEKDTTSLTRKPIKEILKDIYDNKT